jgi:hypothetical protein
MMQLKCPSCGAVASLQAFLADEHAAAALQTALQMPAPLGGRIVDYLGLFRPAKNALSWGRVAKLLEELLEPIKAAQLTHDGIIYAAPLSYWQEALDEMLARRERLDLPVKSHGYLFSIVASKAKKDGAKAETQREEQRRHHPEGKRTGLVQSKQAIEAGLKGMKGALGGRGEKP